MKKTGILAMVIFLVGVVGSVSAATPDLPKWVIVPEDALNFADVTLFCPLDAMDVTNNVTLCYVNGTPVNATIVFNTTTGYPKLTTGKIENAFEFTGGTYVQGNINIPATGVLTFVVWGRLIQQDAGYDFPDMLIILGPSWTNIRLEFATGYSANLDAKDRSVFIINNGTAQIGVEWYGDISQWHMYVGKVDFNIKQICLRVDDGEWTCKDFSSLGGLDGLVYNYFRSGDPGYQGLHVWDVDEARIYNRALTDDEIKLLYLAGRKKLSELANFRQISSPFIDISRDRATFYAGLEVSTSDPNGYVPVPESAVNMSITSAPKLVSDYTGAPFYYQGHYWYRADKIQFNLPIQFETVREKGGFSKTVLLNGDKKTFVYEKEFKVTNPTATRLNVVYSVDPTSLGFSVLQYPQFEIDGIRMAEWRPSNSSTLYLISTDSLEPGEISTHWIRSVWTISKEELEFPAKLDDFRSITDWTVAQRMAENAIKGKTDTYVKVIKIDSNADVSNVTVLVPLNVEDEDDVIEAVALTGSRETLQIERLDDGKIVVKVPADAFVSGHAEIKVLYNKSDSWFSNLLEKIRSLMRKILSLFGLGGG
ncbi:hypothetical protein [Thermococcus piezophilus]|uniref:hypothetical protein n=1 Tax=Thermococcus piezophilus TaxID=1712654 RepID=UPI000B04570E|nr:hypothetical protein [Thermococcus piezophilus]